MKFKTGGTENILISHLNNLRAKACGMAYYKDYYGRRGPG